jgi:hypothetical protein
VRCTRYYYLTLSWWGTPHPRSDLGADGAETGAGAMLVACQLAGLSALGAHYAGVKRRTQRDDAACGCGPAWSSRSDGAQDQKIGPQ